MRMIIWVKMESAGIGIGPSFRLHFQYFYSRRLGHRPNGVGFYCARSNAHSFACRIWRPVRVAILLNGVAILNGMAQAALWPRGGQTRDEKES